MNAKYIILPLFFFSVATPLWVLAINPGTSARVLENFKDVEYKMLFETLPFGQSGSTELLQNEYRMNGLE